MNELLPQISPQTRSLALLLCGHCASDNTVNLRNSQNLIGNKSSVRVGGLGVDVINGRNDDKQQSRPEAKAATARFRRHRKAVARSQTVSFRFLAKCHSSLPLDITMTFLKGKTSKFRGFGETSFQKKYNLGKTHPLNRTEKRLIQHA